MAADAVRAAGKYFPRLLAVILFLTTSGCVSVDYRQVTDANDAASTGIRYYESAPYLLVYSNGSGGLVWQIIAMPDTSREMTIEPHAVWSKAQLNLSFTNGTLQQSTAGGDATTVPAAVIAAVSTFVSIGAAGAHFAYVPEKPSVPGFPPPYLYRISVSGDSVTFTGHQGTTVIRVAVPGAAP